MTESTTSPFGVQNGTSTQTSPFSSFGTSQSAAPNPFAGTAPPTSTTSNPFGGSPFGGSFKVSPPSNPFLSNQDAQTSVFSQPASSGNIAPFSNAPNAFASKSENPFSISTSGAIPKSGATSSNANSALNGSIFAAPAMTNKVFGSNNNSSFGSPSTMSNTNGSTSTPFTGSPTTLSSSSQQQAASQSGNTPQSKNTLEMPAKPAVKSGASTKNKSGALGNVKFGASNTAPKVPSPLVNSFKPQDSRQLSQPAAHIQKSQVAVEIDLLLRKKGIIPPAWPTDSPGDPANKAVMEAFWQTMKGYRAKVRAALIASGKIDDPDKPKRLEDAIDFKGTCEEMCPQFEKITRIVEHDVQGPEKELTQNGKSLWPSPRKMVKALARSAAGQDAPLPDDIRSPKALRRTVDYLIGDLLETNELAAVHGFLWDRTRAIRRDFVFLQASMTAEEMKDQVYCLETITRFHVVALHQMVRPGIVAEGFSEQQEVEQLGKALLSLIQAYEDCGLLDVECENEAEFRAYYVLFNSHNPAIMETVQSWGFKFWGKSQLVKTAVHLVESLQNIWDDRGPLRPQVPAISALNAYSRFFAILRDYKVSYIMACFAEIYFNKVRKAFFYTLLASSRRVIQDRQWWPLEELNKYLYFDDEEDIIAFGEQYGLQFEEKGSEMCLDIWGSPATMEDPFPQLKQAHSLLVVESKRGDHKLPELIKHTVYPKKLDLSTATSVPSTGRDLSQPAISSVGTWNSKPVQNEPVPVPVPAPSFTKTVGNSATTPNSPQISSIFGAPSKEPPSLSETPVAPRHFFQTQNKEQIAEDKSKNGEQNNNTSPSVFFGHNNIGQATKSLLEPQTTPRENGKAAPVQALVPTPTTNTEISISESPEPAANFITSQPLQSIISTPPISLNFAASTTPSIPPPHPPAKEPVRQPDRQASQIESQDQGEAQGLPRDHLEGFTTWVVEGDEGIIQQYVHNTTQAILATVWSQFQAEENNRLAKEEHDRTEAQINAFRTRSLSIKYGYRWRNNAQRSWLRRRGRQDRENRRRFAEQQEQARTADNVVEDFHKSISRSSAKRRTFAESTSASPAFGATSGQAVARKKRREDIASADLQMSRISESLSPMPHGHVSAHVGHRRNQSESLMEGSRMVDKMSVRDIMIQGLHHTSRIDLIPDYDPDLHEKRLPNGVMTPYFRLKARGIVTLPDGSPLARSAAMEPSPDQIVRHKTSLDGIRKLAKILPIKRSNSNTSMEPKDSRHDLGPKPIPDTMGKSWTPKRPTSPKFSQSVPITSSLHHVEAPTTYAEKKLEIEAIKARAREAMLKDANTNGYHNRKRQLETSDEELFAKAKKIRDEMDDGAKWYRDESRKLSGSQS